jgi:hypothetical protein
MINNTSTTNNTYAPLDFKCGTNNVYGRIAYKATDMDDAFGQFEFITMDDNSAVNALTIASNGNVGISGTVNAATGAFTGTSIASVFTRTGSAGQVLQFKFGSSSTGNITVQTAGLGLGGGTRENDLFINTSGTVLIGKTAEGSTDGIHFKTDGRGFYDYDGSGQNVLTLGRQSDGNMIQFNQANSIDGTVGTISVSNNATIYATSSDARLKDNIEDADESGNTIDAIKVRQYDWKNGKHQNHGMIAQELQKIVPEAVSGDAESEEMMGIDYSALVPILVKEIQSLRQRVAQLEE